MENIIKTLQKQLPWESFLSKMEEEGFVRKKSFNFSQISNIKEFKRHYLSGNIMFVENRIQSGCICDPSHLHLSPYVLFRPKTEEWLKKIIVHSQKYKIPITFAGGKTGLSGGYSNFGIIVDLVDLHSYKKSFKINFEEEYIKVEQSALVPDLIKTVQYLSNGKYIFPIQPASALKLPVIIGGLISSNASGITSGKLGSIKNWIMKMRIMKPNGAIVEVGDKDPLFTKIIGGNGYFGVVLSAIIKLYKPLIDSKRAVLFGNNIDLAFNGLQSILDSKVFPLVSEFVVSPKKLPGKFDELKDEHEKNKRTKWAAILKGNSNEVDDFIRIMKEKSNCSWKILNEEEYQVYLQERSTFALLVQTSDTTTDYIAFPGFEDILSEPKNLPEIIKTINSIFTKNGFHKVIFGYGHINFRKGKGILLHMRLPVPLEYFYREYENKLIKVSKTVYEVIITLKEQFNVKHKAEHSSGIFSFFLNRNFRKNYRDQIKKHNAFFNPHLMIYDYLKKEQSYQKPKKEVEKEIFIRALNIYLSNM